MITFKLVCSKCGADWKSDNGCSAACESTPVMAARIAALEKDIERESIRLAACGVVARANTRDSAAKVRKMSPEYRSASLNDVEQAVDREIAERERRKAAEALLYNYASLANAAMFDANRSGYEYDRKGEMVDVRAHFARYKD